MVMLNKMTDILWQTAAVVMLPHAVEMLSFQKIIYMNLGLMQHLFFIFLLLHQVVVYMVRIGNFPPAEKPLPILRVFSPMVKSWPDQSIFT